MFNSNLCPDISLGVLDPVGASSCVAGSGFCVAQPYPTASSFLPVLTTVF